MNRFLPFLFFISAMAMAQDTIEVSKKYKTVLIFPERVVESIIGNSLTFNVDPPSDAGMYSQRIVKLSYNELAKERKDHTNYLVITEDGKSYEFTLELTDIPKKLTWYVNDSTAATSIVPETGTMDLSIDIGGEGLEQGGMLVENKRHLYNRGSVSYSMDDDNVQQEKGEDVTQGEDTGQESERQKKENLLYETDRMEYYRERCYYMQFDKPVLTRAYARKGNIYLWLKGLYYNRNEIYVQFKLENKESVDLDIGFVRFSIATSYKKYSSEQNTELKPVFTYKVPKTVKGGTENHFVVVFSKFGLNENKQLVVQLDEEFGNRDLTMEIDNYRINNPIRF